MGKYRPDNSKFYKCKNFFDNLSVLLYSRYNVVKSCNNDRSEYLVPIGTEDQITYHSKPYYSFRVSDHWNWYASTEKCPYADYIQCLSSDMPKAKKRTNPDEPTTPRMGMQVAMVGEDSKYHCIYGEFFDRRTQTWGWIESDPEEIAKRFL